MKIKHIYTIVIALFLLIQFSCNKETLFEGDANGSELGTLTIYSNSVLGCGSLSVYLDDRLIGKLTDNVSVNPNCGASTSNSVITIKVNEGFQYIKTVGNKASCAKTTRVWVSKGECVVSPIL